MDTGERLAAYLSGDLSPDERAALTAELARDSALRARLERIRDADAALAALPEVALPEGFSARLRAAVQPVLDEQLDDELAVRRARRERRNALLPRIGAAAAVLAVVAVGVGLGVGRPTGQDASTTAADGEPEMAAGLAPSADLADNAFGYLGPTVVDRGRALTDDDVVALADVPEVAALLAARLSAAEAYALQESVAAQPEPAEDAAPGAEVESLRAAVVVDGELTPQEYQAFQACLPELLGSDDRPLVPLYAEFATWQDEPVIAYVLLAESPDKPTLQRLEIWLLGVDDCQLRHFVQRDG